MKIPEFLKQTHVPYFARKKSWVMPLNAEGRSVFAVTTSPCHLLQPVCRGLSNGRVWSPSCFSKSTKCMVGTWMWLSFPAQHYLLLFLSIHSFLGEAVVNVLDFKKDAGLWHGMFAVSCQSWGLYSKMYLRPRLCDKWSLCQIGPPTSLSVCAR